MSAIPTQHSSANSLEWLPLACPECNGLFRAPSQLSEPASCPHCGQEFNLPQGATTTRRRRRTHRKRKKGSKKNLTWEGDDSAESAKLRRRGAFVLRAMVFILSISAVVLAIEIAASRLKDKELQAALGRLTQSLPSKVNEDESNEKELLQVTFEDIEACRTQAEAFLTAPDILALKDLIRDSDRVFPTLVNHYKTTPYSPSVVRDTMVSGQSQTLGKFVSFPVLLGNYETRLIALEVTPNGPRVDWESWVGYSELSPNELILQQPKQPVLIRTKIAADSYYNFDFSDDSLWVSYRLQGEENEPSLQAYLDANSPIRSSLPRIGEPAQAYILKVHYPEQVRSPDQLILSEVINEGWVLGISKEE